MSQGYRILEKNWRFRKSEIDIICSKDGLLVFVEVKTRSSSYMGNPMEAVSKSKQRFIIRAADEYVKKHEGEPEVRFDIIGIVMNSNEERLEHMEDAFYPTL